MLLVVDVNIIFQVSLHRFGCDPCNRTAKTAVTPGVGLSKHLLLAGALSNTQSAVRHQYHYAAACVPGIEHSPHQSSCLVDPMIGKKRYDLSTHFPFEIIRRVACQWCAATCVRTAVVVVVVLLPYVYSLQS